MKKTVIITGPGFEDAEVICPFYRLKEEGYTVEVATSNNLEVKGKFGYPIKPSVQISDLKVENYDAVIVPGGYEAPDRVRKVPELILFISNMFASGKLVTSICHGPWVLISAGIIKGKKATCYPGMKDDLINAGAKYTEAQVVVDGNLITSESPRSIAAWMKETVKWLNSHK